jgi:hypothetical protein
VNNILDKDPELVIGLGDYSYRNTANCWFDIIAPLQDRMKIAIGNHDDCYGRKENPSLLAEYMNNFSLTEQCYSFNY